jgi:hypothetical protein
MSLRLAQRLPVVATAFFLFVAAADSSMPARAADPPPSLYEAAVLDRIFANWKARHDRVRSFHFTYDCRTTYRKRKVDPLSNPRKQLDHDQAYDKFGLQVWVDGDDRMCLLITPSFQAPDARPTDTGRVVARFVAAGNTSYMYCSGPWLETSRPPDRAFAPYGRLYRTIVLQAEEPNISFEALFLTYRPRPPWLRLKREQCRLVDENAAIDNGHYTKFHRVLNNMGPSEEALWVSPAREDAVVHWTTRTQSINAEGSIKYERDQRYGWVPSEWTCDYVGQMLEESRMTAYSINEKIDPAVFSLEFPPETPVEDTREAKSAETIRHYVVGRDGSKRSISHEEYNRLLHLGKPFGPPIPAKAPAK